MRATNEERWPHVVIDAHGADDTRNPAFFRPLITPRREPAKHSPQPEVVVENEPGLCEALTAVAARCKQGGMPLCTASRMLQAAPNLTPPPDLTDATRRQQAFDFPLRAVEVANDAEVAPPLLFNAMLRNPTDSDAVMRALGDRFLLPRRSGVLCSRARRWRELAAVLQRERGECGDGYRIILMDPPWHSRSVQRAQSYATRDRRHILSELVPAIRALRSSAGCLLACWVTNAKRVQAFVEESLFPQCGAAPIARWYWLKLAADGGWATGTPPTSPHKKPWEALLIAYAGRLPPPPVPRRLVIVCVPYADHHSAKPNLDLLLRKHSARHLARSCGAADDEGAATHGSGGSACDGGSGDGHISGRVVVSANDLEGEEEEHADRRAWEALPKLELYARDVRPHWHACGDEVLRYRRAAFHGGGTPSTHSPESR